MRSALRAGIFFSAALSGGALFVIMLWTMFGDTITSAREEYVVKLARETLTAGTHYPPPVFTPRPEDLPTARIIAIACISADAVVIRGAAKKGYGGDIEFVISFIGDDTGGIRIIRHRETPGIADFLNTPEGGKQSIDGIAGATITSAAMTMALADVLKWREQMRPCAQSNSER
ncbi:MAG: FMN-binding protein [Gammaproteobacteria bacterium]